MSKIIITGFDDQADWDGAYNSDEKDDYIGIVHAWDYGCGDRETAICSLDLVHGIQFKPTTRPITCPQCKQSLEYYKTVRIGRG